MPHTNIRAFSYTIQTYKHTMHTYLTPHTPHMHILLTDTSHTPTTNHTRVSLSFTYTMALKHVHHTYVIHIYPSHVHAHPAWYTPHTNVTHAHTHTPTSPTHSSHRLTNTHAPSFPPLPRECDSCDFFREANSFWCFSVKLGHLAIRQRTLEKLPD